MDKFVYIVMGKRYGRYETTHEIDSVWTSEGKAKKRCEMLNSAEMADWRGQCRLSQFWINTQPISK